MPRSTSRTGRSPAAAKAWACGRRSTTARKTSIPTLTADATGYNGEQWLAAAGVDFPVGDAGVIGIGGGYVKNKGDFDQWGGEVDADGWQVGVYGAYDPGTFYIKAAASYSDLNGGLDPRRCGRGDLGRGVRLARCSNLWAANAEIGYHLPLGGAQLTPYAGVDYVSVKLKEFTEGGSFAGRLIVLDSKDDFFTSEVGVKLSGKIGGVVPEVKAAWRHEFTDGPAAFIGGPMPSSRAHRSR